MKDKKITKEQKKIAKLKEKLEACIKTNESLSDRILIIQSEKEELLNAKRDVEIERKRSLRKDKVIEEIISLCAGFKFASEHKNKEVLDVLITRTESLCKSQTLFLC